MSKQARVQARAVRQAQELAARRTAKRIRIATAAGGIVIAALVVAIIAVVANSGPKPVASTSSSPAAVAAAPANTTANGAIALGSAGAPVKLEIYLDYMCPFCGRFEKANAADIDRLLHNGKIRLELHPLAFLDRMSSGTRYSTRAAAAIAAVADRSPESVLAFSTALFSAQPAESSPGLGDDRIAALAVQAGVPAEVAERFAERRFEPWIASSTEKATAAGVTGTPTVKINGTVFEDLYAAGALRAAVESAQG